MAKYNTYRYIYPPRPKNAIPSTELDFWDGGSLLAQPKFNGSNCVIFTNGEDNVVMNRHNQRLTNFRLTTDEIKDIYRYFLPSIMRFETKKVSTGQLDYDYETTVFDFISEKKSVQGQNIEIVVLKPDAAEFNSLLKDVTIFSILDEFKKTK